MGKCTHCGDKIQYNKYVKRRGKIYHPKCWKAILNMKKVARVAVDCGVTEEELNSAVKLLGGADEKENQE